MRKATARERSASSTWPGIAAFAGAAVAALPACSGATPRLTSIEAPPPATPAPAPAPRALPARWVEGGGATLVGPAIGDRTLVLLGGRLGVLARGGAFAASPPPPEPLAEIVEVPAEKGAHRLVARGAHGVYRIDDPARPLVPLARSEAEILGIGAGPKVVVVWTTSSDHPRAIDVETGAAAAFDLPAAPPPRAIAFRDARRGAAVFHAVGLAVTTDGGATWKLPSDSSEEALRTTRVRLEGDVLRAYPHTDSTMAAEIDVDAAKVGRFEQLAPASRPEPLLRWIRTTERDPLEAAAQSGVALSPTVALVASHGLAARVDLETGAVTEVAELAKSDAPAPCALSRAGAAAWIACGLPTSTADDLYDPFGVLRVAPLAATGKIALDEPVVRRNGEAELRTSPSGGAMLLSGCAADDGASACVRQPDGKWVSIAKDVDLWERGAGPLADGHVAFLRGLPGDDDEEDDGDAEGGDEELTDKRDGRARGPRVVALGPNGKERVLGAVVLENRAGEGLRVASPIEEDEDGTLHFALLDDEGAAVFAQPPGGDAAPGQRLENVRGLRLHAGRGLAIAGERRVVASRDAGATWAELPLPDRAREALASFEDVMDEPGTFAVSEVGAKLDAWLLLGWGEASEAAPAAIGAPADEGGGTVLERRRRSPPPGPAMLLSCADAGAADSIPPSSSSSQTKELLATKKPPAKGLRRESSWTSGRAGVLSTSALLEQEGPAEPGSKPAKWTIRWLDPTEIGGRVREWKGPAPAGATWSTTLRAAASAGPRAVFAVRSGQDYFAVRTKQGGGEIVKVEAALAPSGDAVLGADPGETIAWLRDRTVVAWRRGEAPRAIAALAVTGGPTPLLGEPTRAGIPMLVTGHDWSALRFLPAPAAKKGEPAPPAHAAPPVGLDGWALLGEVRGELPRLPACGAKPKDAARFAILRSSLLLSVDGAALSGGTVVYDVRVRAAGSEQTAKGAPPGASATPSEVCIAAIAATVTPRRGPPPRSAPGAASAASGASATSGTSAKPAVEIGFVRADFVAKRAEGGERGLGEARVRRLGCSLAPQGGGNTQSPAP